MSNSTPTPNTPSFALVRPGTLTVAVADSAPPALTITDNTLGGLDGALIEVFVSEYHLKIAVVQATDASVLLDVEQGKADLGADSSYTAASAGNVYYTYPFFWERAAMFTPTGAEYKDPTSLTGGKVGTISGSVWAPFLESSLKSGAVLFPDAAAAAAALISGEIDGYVYYFDALGTPSISHDPRIIPTLMTPGQFGIPATALSTFAYNVVGCHDQALAQALNDEMAKLHRGSPSPWDATLVGNGLTQSVDSPLQAPQEVCS